MRSRARRTVILIAILLGVGAVVAGVLSDGRALVGQREGAPPAASSQATATTRRSPAVAGMFYPASAADLQAEVTRRLDQATATPPAGELMALIVPHAGYSYSAGVAAYAYRQLRSHHFDKVVVIGPSHHVGFGGAALSGEEEWDTPLGPVAIDRAAGEELTKLDPDARVLEQAHAPEHSIEVQLPFLQATLGNFKLVPILMADFSEGNCRALSRALAEWARGRSVLLIASSDMSHYPSYDDAVRVDKETLKAIQTLDAGSVAATTRKLMAAGTAGLATCLCGEGPVETVLMAARLLGADKAKVLRYGNSGDIPGTPRDRVVGYGAVAIYRSAGAGTPATGPADKPKARGGTAELSQGQQQRLLSLARATIQRYVATGKSPEAAEADLAFQRPAAAFVTLKKAGALRGCIGSLEPTLPLWSEVRDKAISAATRDPRFRPVTPEELADLEIEISVLSPLRRVKSADEIELRKHGVVVAADGRRGVFLPQVAEETGWSRDEFLSHLCSEKAGLPPDAWRRGADLYVFTVQSFSSPAPREQSRGKPSGK